ncbi:MAG: hypothetical protein KGZ39_00115 [Simkania sp.]|nr:hypothetical protein [Simkania sp.]
MESVRSILYSPFSPNDVFTLRKRSLLLQFFLSALKRNAAKELAEHISLFSLAFPEISCTTLKKTMQKLEHQETIPSSQQKLLCTLLTPFIHACHQEEGLILFLLRHHQNFKKYIPLGVLLRSWHAEGWDQFVCDMKIKWQARGFIPISYEIVELMKTL